MRTTLVLYAAFVALSLLLWSGCFGRPIGAGAVRPVPAASASPN
jgi:hypothetical protein